MFSKWPRLNFSWFSRGIAGMDNLMEKVAELSLDLADDLRRKNDNQQLRKLLTEHLETVSLLKTPNEKLTDFKPGLDWVNVTEPLSLHKHLKGKIVVLDFFTYCCINCMHILPDLKRLEQEISVKDGLVVIGVHSAKFANEKNTDNIEAAVRRYDITHPVVNDNYEAMWQALNIHCWPTLYVLGPNCEPLLMLQGEGHYETLKVFVTEAISFYKKKESLSEKNVSQISAYSFPKNANILSYPGKIILNDDGSLIVIADSAHNRIIVANSEGEILHEIGKGSAGLTDGSFSSAKFSSPQGLAFVGSEKLFVADTENHCIREINLTNKDVRTVVGIGTQGHDYIGGKVGGKQAISSPWDLCLVNDVLVIAMAGTHQVWGYFLNDTKLWKKSYKVGTCAAIVGSGREENRNNAYPSSAALAQPSGLAYDGEKFIYFADSESSTIRAINMETGAVLAVIGGTMDPRNLFAFGDKDGIGLDVKLQHPLGVAWSKIDNVAYIADTYNHKIKKVDKSMKKCTTIGEQNLLKFNEPGGLCVHQDKMYVADTNNHSIKVVSIPEYNISTFDLKVKYNTKKECEVFHEASITVNPNEANLDLGIVLSLSEKHCLTEEAPSKWLLYLPGNRVLTKDENFTLSPKWNLNIVKTTGKDKSISVKCRLFLCIDGKCTVKELLYTINLLFDEAAPKTVQCTINSKL